MNFGEHSVGSPLENIALIRTKKPEGSLLRAFLFQFSTAERNRRCSHFRLIFFAGELSSKKIIKEITMGRGRKNKTKKMTQRKNQAKKKAKLKAKKSGAKKKV